jgi:hypothetical protein
MEKDFQANGTQKQAEVTIFMSDKAYFKPKLVKRNKECHFILIKGSICQVDITILNITILYIYIYINVGAINFIKQTLLNIKMQTDSNTIIVDVINAIHVHQYIREPEKKSTRKLQK